MEADETLCKICRTNIFLKANFYLTGENKKVVEWTNLQPRNAEAEFSYAITAAPLCLHVMTM